MMSRNLALLLILLCILPITLFFFGQPYPFGSYDFYLSNDDEQFLLSYSYHILDSYFNDADQHSDKKWVSTDSKIRYDKLFITLFTDGRTRGCQSGSNDENDQKRLLNDITEATIKSILDTRFGGPLVFEETSNVTIMFTFLYNKRELMNYSLELLENYIELGVHSIEIKQGETSAFFKESVPISNNYDIIETLERLCDKAYLHKDCYLDTDTQIYIYDTFTFFGGRDYQIHEIYRYNYLIDVDDIDNDFINQRIALTRDWFLNMVNTETGLLEYLYLPSKDVYSNKNNHIRQMASLWSMIELRNFLEDDTLDYPIDRLLSFYMDYLTNIDNYTFVNIDEDGNIAYNAFLLLSLIGLDVNDTNSHLMDQLARGILVLQKEDGSFNTSFVYGGEVGIDFYPGESMLALMKYYKITDNQSYLDSVQKAFYYYREYWRNNKNTAFIPWHTQSYRLLYEETRDSQIADFIFEMNNWLVDGFQIHESEYSDEIGGFPLYFPTFSTSVYLEGINDAFFIASLINDSYYRGKYEDSIRLGARFILQTQFTQHNSFYCVDPTKVIGGFKESLTSNEMRIDYTQHAVMALLKTYENRVFH